MLKDKISRYFVVLSIFTFLAIFFFVVEQSYNNLISATADVKNSPLINSVSPNLDTEVLDEIEKRQEITQ